MRIIFLRGEMIGFGMKGPKKKVSLPIVISHERPSSETRELSTKGQVSLIFGEARQCASSFLCYVTILPIVF